MTYEISTEVTVIHKNQIIIFEYLYKSDIILGKIEIIKFFVSVQSSISRPWQKMYHACLKQKGSNVAVNVRVRVKYS